MYKTLICCSLILFISLLSYSQKIPLDSTMLKAFRFDGYKNTGQKFKQFNADDTYGKVYSVDSLKGKTTFVNFWMEHCTPCIVEFEALNELYNKYGTNKDFQFLSFTLESKADVSRIINEYKIQYPIICIDKYELYKLNYSLGFPTNMVIDSTGQIKIIKSGGSEKIEEVKEEFQRLYIKEIERLIIAKQF